MDARFGYSIVIPATNPREQELRIYLFHCNKGNKIRLTKRAPQTVRPGIHNDSTVSTMARAGKRQHLVRYRTRWESCCASVQLRVE